MHPADECIVMYAIFTSPDCKGVPVTTSLSYANEQELEDALTSDWFDENGERKQIRSIKHPAASKIEIFEEDGYLGGSFVTVNEGTIEDRPGLVCTTIR